MAGQALDGIRVIDLTHYIAGPYCTKLLAMYGADVIKVEPPGGDPARHLLPFAGDDPDPEKSGLFLALNMNKKSVTLNLKTETGKEIFRELIRDADIVVENFAPRVMPSLGLSYESLRETNPNLIMTSISNFGQTGPYRDFKASDLTLFAMGGPMNVMGKPGREPLKLGGNHVQYQAGNVAAAATLGAQYGKEFADLPGQHIDVSMYETQLGTINFRITYLMAYQYRGDVQTRSEEAALGYPSGIFPCAEGYIIFNTTQPGDWPKVCALLERPDLLHDERFSTIQGQNNPGNADEFLMTIWYPWVLEHTAQDIMVKAQAVGILCTAILRIDEVVESRHFNQRNFFPEVSHPVVGTFRYPGPPLKLPASPGRMGRAPLLGEHNEDVYINQLGISRTDLVLLADRGVI